MKIFNEKQIIQKTGQKIILEGSDNLCCLNNTKEAFIRNLKSLEVSRINVVCIENCVECSMDSSHRILFEKKTKI